MGAEVLAAIAVTFLYGTLVGWLGHWVLHQRWAGPLYRGHMNHHTKQYPPGDLKSESYRSAGREDSTFIFTPILTLAFALFVYGLVKLNVEAGLLVFVLAEALVIGFLHDWVHTQFHLTKTVLDRWGWFRKLRELHFTHHRRMAHNFGIFWFGWDRVFRTYRR